MWILHQILLYGAKMFLNIHFKDFPLSQHDFQVLHSRRKLTSTMIVQIRIDKIIQQKQTIPNYQWLMLTTFYFQLTQLVLVNRWIKGSIHCKGPRTQIDEDYLDTDSIITMPGSRECDKSHTSHNPFAKATLHIPKSEEAKKNWKYWVTGFNASTKS